MGTVHGRFWEKSNLGARVGVRQNVTSIVVGLDKMDGGDVEVFQRTKSTGCQA